MSKKNLLENILSNNLENRDDIDKGTFQTTFLEKRLFLLPKKLYKYREGNKNDLDALKNNYVWFSQPKECDDLKDSTLNFDIKKQSKKLQKYLEKNIDNFVLCFLKKWDNKLSKKLNIEKIKYIRENCFDDDGKLLIGEAISYLGYKFSTDDLPFLEKTIKKFNDAIIDNKEQLTILVNKTIDLINDTNNLLREGVMAYCLCEDYKNEALWSKYANNNKGFCIEYKLDKSLIFPNDVTKQLFYLFPLKYGKKKRFDIRVFFEKAIDNVMLDRTNSDLSLDQTIEFNKQLLTKDSSWKWQKEWRVVLKYEQNNKQPFPFINRIIIGSQAPKKLIKDLIKICGHKIPLFQQLLNDSGSEYVYKRITNYEIYK